MRLALLTLALLAGACGGAKGAGAPAPESAPPAPEAEAPAPKADTAPAPGPSASAMPTECHGGAGKDVCLPPPPFVQKLCGGSFPDVALRMFLGSAPWTRGYVTRDVDGWNAEGGAAARARLFRDEEVVLLRKRVAAAGGIQVGSGGGYLVLRVDGNCYTFDDLEVTTKKPPRPRAGPVVFRYLDEATQNALLKSPRLEAAYQKRRKECKGVVSGAVSKACEAADRDLASAVPEELAKGLTLPAPARLP